MKDLNKKIKVDLIIPIYYGLGYANRLINSLAETNFSNKLDVIIILVDDTGNIIFNNFLIKLIKKITSITPIQIVTQVKNGGFIEACYTGINVRKSEYKLLINSDTLPITPGWLEKMISSAESDDRIAIVNPTSNNAPVIDIPMREGNNVKILSKLSNDFQIASDGNLDVVTANGFFLLIKSKYIEKYGFFDRIFLLGYGEETDLHFRYWKNGLRMIVNPNVFVYHKGEGSFDNRNARLKRNRDIVMDRYGKDYCKELPIFSNTSELLRLGRKCFESFCLEFDFVFLCEYKFIDDFIFNKSFPLKKTTYDNPLVFESVKYHFISNALIELGYNVLFLYKSETNTEVINSPIDRLYNPLPLSYIIERNWQIKTIYCNYNNNIIIEAKNIFDLKFNDLDLNSIIDLNNLKNNSLELNEELKIDFNMLKLTNYLAENFDLLKSNDILLTTDFKLRYNYNKVKRLEYISILSMLKKEFNFISNLKRKLRVIYYSISY